MIHLGALCFQYFSVVTGWLLLHYLFWDPASTTEDERFTVDKIVDFATNPDTAMGNVFIGIGNVRRRVFRNSRA